MKFRLVENLLQWGDIKPFVCVKIDSPKSYVIVTHVTPTRLYGIPEYGILEDDFTQHIYDEDQVWGVIDKDFIGEDRYKNEIQPLIDKVLTHQLSRKE